MATKEVTNGKAKPDDARNAVAKTRRKNPTVSLEDGVIKKLVLFEEKASKISELQKLVNDYGKISETLKGLSQFKGASAESVQFTIADLTSDANFTTYNSTLVNMVIDSLSDKLKLKSNQLVDDILNFEM